MNAALSRRLAAVLLAAAIAGAMVAFADSDPRLGVRITAQELGKPIPPGFVGLSIEYPALPAYLGREAEALDPVFLALVRNLNPGQAPVLRIGGDSTDWTWWPLSGLPRPGGIRFTITADYLSVLGAAARELDARVIAGINLEADSRALAAGEAQALLDALGEHLAYLELGNEPENYRHFAWYVNAAGVHVHARPRSWDFADYLHDYAHIAAALPAGVPLAGLATGAPKWWAATAPFLAAFPQTGILTYHRYPLRGCGVSAKSPQSATIPHLLAPSSSDGLAASISNALAGARARGVPARVDELNSVACGGTRGVSDTFASALWMTDAIFAMARAGVAGVNVHSGVGLAYAPFSFSHTQRGWSAHVAPDYYGMLLFTRAAPPGSRLLAVHVPKRHPALRVWATRGSDGKIRVVAINTSASRAQSIALSTPSQASAATVQRLLAPSLSARADVTLADQSFGTRTATGVIAGRPRLIRLPGERGRFQLSLPPASAALVGIP
jgi:hypothetical protein